MTDIETAAKQDLASALAGAAGAFVVALISIVL